MSKKKYEEFANKLVELIGGVNNVSFFTHCVTRLRFNVKDKGLVKTEDIEKLPVLLGTQWQGDQFQVIIGNDVTKVYDIICEEVGFQKEIAINENLDKKKFDFSPQGIFNAFLDTLSSILAPCIPAIVGCGLMQGILYSIQSFGWVDATSDIYVFLYTCANTAFYFLPILVAFAAGKRFKCNPYVAATLGAILIHPTFISLAGTHINLFGIIPIDYANYSSSVVPAILTVYFMSWVEKGLKKIVPSMIDIIVTPFLSLIISAIVGFSLLAPLGNYVGTFVADGCMWLYTTAGPLGAMVLAAAYPFILATGMQVAMTPIIALNLSTLGYDVLYPCIACSNAAMSAVAIYIFFKAKNKNVKSLGSSTGITALIGVTEPVLFGLILKYKKALWATIAGGAIGACIMGLFQVQYLSFGFVPFGTILLAMTDTFSYYIIGVLVSMIISIIVLHFLKFDEEE